MAQTPVKQPTQKAPPPPAQVAPTAPRLPYIQGLDQRYGISPSAWAVLVGTVWPEAKDPAKIELAIAYCLQLKLDPFSNVIYIVPSRRVKRDPETGAESWYTDEQLWWSIGSARIRAHRSGEYAGCDRVQFGPDETKQFTREYGKGDRARKEHITLTFPSWAQMTVYRIVGGVRVPFHGSPVRWMGRYGRRGGEMPNDRWQSDPYGQLAKCAEAQALRQAFPEHLMGPTVDEIRDRVSELPNTPRPTWTEMDQPRLEGAGLEEEVHDDLMDDLDEAESTKAQQGLSDGGWGMGVTPPAAQAGPTTEPPLILLGADGTELTKIYSPEEYIAELVKLYNLSSDETTLMDVMRQNSIDALRRLTPAQRQTVNAGFQEAYAELQRQRRQ